MASQAAKFQCSFIEERINAFVDTRCREYIDTLSQAKFEEFVSSALKRRQAPDVSLGDEVKRNVDEICSFDYCFDRLKREIAQLKQVLYRITLTSIPFANSRTVTFSFSTLDHFGRIQKVDRQTHIRACK